MGTKAFDNYADLITFTRASGGTALRPVSYGAELVTNGTFDTDTSGWTAVNSTLSVSGGGIAVADNGLYSVAYQAVTTTVGKVYQLTLDAVSKNDPGFDFIYGWGTNTPDGVTFYADNQFLSADAGAKTLVFVATSTTTYISVGSIGASTAVYDNISVKEVLFDQPDGTLTLFNHLDNIPRIEYDADGNRLGLLIEEQRTNLLPSSEDFTTGGWSAGGNSDVTSNYAESLDNQQNASLLSGATTGYTGSHRLARVVNISSSTAYTFSIWIKLLTATTASIEIFDGSTGGVSRSSSSASTEWQRLTVTRTSGGSTSQFGLAVGLTDGDILIYGAQLEAGSFPTSYIPTSGSTATRAADVASIPVADFGYNQKQGTVVVEAQSTSGATNAMIASLETDSNNRIEARYSSSPNTKTRCEVVSGGVSQARLEVTDSNEVRKISFAFTKDDFASSANGSAVVTDTSGTLPSVTKMDIGEGVYASSNLNGHIKSIKYYPRRLSNAQLQELTQ